MTFASFGAYLAALEAAVAGLTSTGRRRFAVWCARGLHTSYAAHLPDPEASDAAATALSVLEAHTVAPQSAASVIESAWDALHLIDPDDLDTTERAEYGALKLLECLELALALFEDDDPAYAVAAAQCPIDVIDVIMTDELHLDTRDPSTHIGHPLLGAEIDAQMTMLARLAVDAEGAPGAR